MTLTLPWSMSHALCFWPVSGAFWGDSPENRGVLDI